MNKEDAHKEISIAICITEMNISHIFTKYKKDSTRKTYIAKEMDDLEYCIKAILDEALDGSTKEN